MVRSAGLNASIMSIRSLELTAAGTMIVRVRVDLATDLLQG
jgi:hypothetical protein